MYTHPPEHVRFGAFELDLIGSLARPVGENRGSQPDRGRSQPRSTIGYYCADVSCSHSSRRGQIAAARPSRRQRSAPRTVQYDLAFTRSFDYLYPAYLESGDGGSAAGEFQKLIDNPGLGWEFITVPLARLQHARAERLMGDNASAPESYEEFLKI